MLIGSAAHNIDAKGRVVIPSKYRADLGATVFAFKGVDGCIRIYPEAEFQKVLDKLRQSSAQMTAFRRKIASSAEQLNLDSQGRILISEELRREVGITERVRMVGMIDWLELWSEEVLEEKEDTLSKEQELAFMVELGLA